MKQIFGRPLGDDGWTRAQLPTALGGLGLRSAEPIQDMAFAVTVKKTEPLTERMEANVTCRICRKDVREEETPDLDHRCT